ncbi:hypothetical protein [Bifidobacterium crudilactis]|uniref:hypothetical protein n=1 Tax=Bifidobacterium crudilactis TaxID=327277 RepID=UPI002647D96B|nr:hypothetical protein [Bifidobacterium crudilactis]MDN6209987.1 hypothetical protein [Bifidobacterium crudilactis]
MVQKNTIPDDLNFDAADKASYDEGIVQAGKALENRYIVRFPSLYVKTYLGNTYRLPLAVKADYFDSEDNDASPLEQIKSVLARENPGKKKEIDRELSVTLLAIGDRYADVIAAVQMASLGKFKASSVISKPAE